MPNPSHVPLDLSAGPIWERFFAVAPLVVVATREEDGRNDLAPKHLAMPLSWQDHFGFVCTPAHATYRNAKREGWFTVSFARHDQVLLTSLAAAPRDDQGSKPALDVVPTVPARKVPGVLLREAYLQLECELERIVDDFAENSLVCGRIVAAQVDPRALRGEAREDPEVLADCPPMVYLHPGRFAPPGESLAFPYHRDWSR